MKMGVQAGQLGPAFSDADQVLLCENPELQWNLAEMADSSPTSVVIKADIEAIIEFLVNTCKPGDQIIIMSNGGFDKIHRRLVQAMQTRY